VAQVVVEHLASKRHWVQMLVLATKIKKLAENFSKRKAIIVIQINIPWSLFLSSPLKNLFYFFNL
jgi:hypothetical protein